MNIYIYIFYKIFVSCFFFLHFQPFDTKVLKKTSCFPNKYLEKIERRVMGSKNEQKFLKFVKILKLW